jgi:hypothetical protein
MWSLRRRVCLGLQDSDEAKAQTEWETAKRRELEERRREAARTGAGDADGDDFGGDSSGGKNQFNYSERAAQTYNSVMKVGCCCCCYYKHRRHQRSWLQRWGTPVALCSCCRTVW